MFITKCLQLNLINHHKWQLYHGCVYFHLISHETNKYGQGFGGRERDVVYECTFHSSNIKATQLVCNPENIINISWFDIGVGFKDFELAWGEWPILDKSPQFWQHKVVYSQFPMHLENKRNGRTVRLCPFWWKTTSVVVHFAHASPWLFTIPISKPLLDFVHLLLICGSRTKATHLSPSFF